MVRIGSKTAATLFLAVATAVAYGQQVQPPPAEPEIVTDRPDTTESSIVVPKGSLQFENGLTWTSDHGQAALDFSETLLRLGVFDRTELRIVIPNYVDGLTGTASASGFGDIALGMKQQLGPLPGGFDLFIKFPWSRDLKQGWSIAGMQSLFWYTEAGRRNLTWEPTFYLEKQLTKPWDAFAEYAGDFARWGGSKDLAHFGTAYRITPKSQVDFHFGIGLSPAKPGRFFAVGYSFRIDNFWRR